MWAAIRAAERLVMAVDFRRKNIRMPSENYIGRRLYFLTLCFNNRRRIGADPKIAIWLIERLRAESAKCGFLVHAFCVMPDHIHVLAQGNAGESDLMRFVESYKKGTAFRLEARIGKRLWQFKYYDHIVRTAEVADRIAWYVWMNPVRKGICRAPRDYPFLGSMTEAGTAMLLQDAPEKWTPPWKSEMYVAPLPYS
jgi:REP element-mobilizing transposase RayT